MGYTHSEMNSILSFLSSTRTVETLIKEQELAIQTLEKEIARLQDLERKSMYNVKGIFDYRIKELRHQLAVKRAYLNSWQSYRAG